MRIERAVSWGGGLLAVLLTAILLHSPGAGAQPAADPVGPSRDPVADEMALRVGRALSRRLTVWTRRGGAATYVSHCRRAVDGCPARVAAISRYISEVAQGHAIDPFVLAAMAIRESGLDPFVQGAAGEWGIVQLHPRGVGGRVRFVRSEAYRNRCRRIAGACQREILEVGATHLTDAIERCSGLSEGLGAYNRGVCGETAYSRRVLRERTRLLALIKDTSEESPSVVD